MVFFKDISDEDKLRKSLNQSKLTFYNSYSSNRKDEILSIFKESKEKALAEINKDFEALQKKRQQRKIQQEQEENERLQNIKIEQERRKLQNYTDDLKNQELSEGLKYRGLDNLSQLTEDLIKKANFPNDLMQISSFITQLSNVGNPTNMHMLNMSQTNVSQNFVFIKLLDEIKKDNSKIIQQNDEIIKLLRIISEK